MKRFFTLCAAILCAAVGFAQTEKKATVDGIEWTYTTIDESTCMVGTPEKRNADGEIDSDAMLAVAKSTSGNIVIPGSFDGYTVVEIGREAFRNVEITGVTIPSGVTKIGKKAFYRSGITYAEIQGNVTLIDEEAFSRTKITSITLPESLVRIGEQAFERTLLTSIRIPKSVMYLGNESYWFEWGDNKEWIEEDELYADVFGECDEMIEVKVDADNEVYADIDGVLYTKDLKTLLYNPGGRKNAVIAEGTEVIYSEAFADLQSTTIALPNTLKTIGRFAFEGAALTSITIPASVTEIGEGAFERCEYLTDVYNLATTPQAISDHTFPVQEDWTEQGPVFTINNITLHVPVGRKAAYEVATGWSLFANIVEMTGNEETGDGEYKLIRVFPEKAAPSDVVRLKILGSYDLSYSNQTYIALRNAKGDIVGKWDIDNNFNMKNVMSLDDFPDAVFNLQTAELGKYDVCVGDMILKDAFELEAGDGYPDVSVEIIGRNDILFGRAQNYSISFANHSNVAAYNTPFVLFVSDKDGQLDVSFNFTVDNYGNAIPQSVKDYCKNQENGVVINTPQYGPMRGYVLNIPYIAPNGQANYIFRIRVNGQAPSDPAIHMVYSCGIPVGAYEQGRIGSQGSGEQTADDWNEHLNVHDRWDHSIAECLAQYFFGWTRNTEISIDVDCIYASDKVLEVTKDNSQNNVSDLVVNKIASLLACVGTVTFGADSVFNAVLQDIWNGDGCLGSIRDHRIIEIKWSQDPNEMTGPAGYDDNAHYIRPIRDMGYLITYENKPEATAPAHEVFINDKLNASQYDLSTFSFTAFGWADKIWNVGGSKIKEFTRDISYTVNGTDILVRVSGKFDEKTGEASWSMVSLDKNGQHIEDPDLGYLLPNNDNGDGEGFVSFSIEHKADPASGSTVSNKATIIFDANQPIETNTYVNTFDTDYPTSKIANVERNDDKLVLTIEGSDATSGISSYTIYVFKDGGSAELLASGINENTYTMPYDSKVNYAFCAIATDNVGWNEVKDIKPEMEFASGISNIVTDTRTSWAIYSYDGRIVTTGEGSVKLSLPGGVYIIRIGDTSRKVIIK
ncbi:MAG: leucine-rich repeat domain-containing protein [Prevotella sp.]|nr:leucine-rich repeat domain-containing protein [Prevotella sp.]